MTQCNKPILEAKRTTPVELYILKEGYSQKKLDESLSLNLLAWRIYQATWTKEVGGKIKGMFANFGEFYPQYNEHLEKNEKVKNKDKFSRLREIARRVKEINNEKGRG